MAQKSFKTPIRATKIGFIILFIGFFLFLKIDTITATYYSFESPDYIVGSINGQNGWIGTGSSTVSLDSKYTGNQGLKLDNTTIHGFSTAGREDTEETDAGEIDFWFYIPTPENFYDILFLLNSSSANINLELLYSGGNFNNFLPCPNTISPNTWYNWKIKWDSAVSSSTYQLDCGTGFFTANLLNDFSGGNQGFSNFYFSSESGSGHGHGKIYIDDVVSPIYPQSPAGLYADLSPTYPAPNSTTTIEGGSFEFSGNYNYSTSSDWFFSNLDVILNNTSDSSLQYVFSKDIYGTSTGSYFIPAEMPNGTYDISYRLIYNFENLNIEEGMYLLPTNLLEAQYYYPTVSSTRIVIENSLYSSSTQYALPPLEDCDAESGTDKWLCKIKNALISIFIPSPSRVAELNNSLSSFGDKFPFNYLNVDSAFLKNIRDGIQSTSTISLTVLGNTGSINFDLWQNSTSSVAGTVQNVSSILKGFFTIIILAGFLAWAINYGKRIFK